MKSKLEKLLTSFDFDFFPRLENPSVEVKKIVGKLKVPNYSRQTLVAYFLDSFTQACPKEITKLRVAVVGGGFDEPELLALQQAGFELDVAILGIDEKSSVLLDLNASHGEYSEKYDLVLCSQVLEHVWDLEASFHNLSQLLDTNGLLWISCPASNRFHGSPDYYFAGFSESFLHNMVLKFQLEPVRIGSFGTHRNYASTHLLNVWLSPLGHKFPLLFAYDSKSFGLRILLTTRFMIRLIFLSSLSSKNSQNPRFVTESWILAKRRS